MVKRFLIAFAVLVVIAIVASHDRTSSNKTGSSSSAVNDQTQDQGKSSGASSQAVPRVALKCVEDRSPDSLYMFYGDSLKERFDFSSNGDIGTRGGLDLTQTTDSEYTYNCTDIHGYEGTIPCDSLELERDTLKLTEKDSVPQSWRDNHTTDEQYIYGHYECRMLSQTEAGQIMQQRNAAIQKHESDEEKENSAKHEDQMRRNKL